MAYEEAFFRLLPQFITLIVGGVFFMYLTKAFIIACRSVLWGVLSSIFFMSLLCLSLV